MWKGDESHEFLCMPGYERGGGGEGGGEGCVLRIDRPRHRISATYYALFYVIFCPLLIILKYNIVNRTLYKVNTERKF